MLFEALDYNKINHLLRDGDLKFKYPEQLMRYLQQHPNLILKGLSNPVSLDLATKKVVSVFIPELRKAQDSHVICFLGKGRHLHVHLNVGNANHRKLNYWMNLDHDFSLCHSLPLYYITVFLHHLKPAFLNLYQLWQDYPNKLVFFDYENNINNNLNQIQRLCTNSSHNHRIFRKVNLSQLIKDHHIKWIKDYFYPNVAWYNAGGNNYLIKSKKLLKALKKVH